MHAIRAFCYIFTLIKLDKHILNKIFDFDLIKKYPKNNDASKIIALKSRTMIDLFSNNSVNKALPLKRSMVKNYNANKNKSNVNIDQSENKLNLNL